jgi:hypothetical protein
MCCFDDLLPYLQVLSDEERTSLFGKMSGFAEVTGDLVSSGIGRAIAGS